MSSSMAQETTTTISDLTEVDSDGGGSSSNERDLRKKGLRLHGDADFAGPKKRRKQTTPVRFSSSLMSGLQDESNEDDDEEEVDEEGELEGEMQSQSEEPWPGPSNQLTMGNHHLQALSGFPGALASYLPLSTFPLTDPTHIPRTSIAPAPVRIFNPEAYCDLCNKEFCNKYFLKTHKANKHGIYVDSPGPNPNESANNVPTQLFQTGGGGGGASVGAGGGYSSNTIKLEPPATPPMPSVPCEICQKRFKNEESVRKHKQKMHNNESIEHTDQSLPASQSEDDRETPRSSPGGIETLFKQDFGMEQEETTFMPAPRHLSPQSIQQARDSGFNADRLRRLGVINPDAFCEICCKEYCNKYFLRTHKMKRHGIVIQDNEKSPSNPAAALTWHQVQTSPLNLIVTESGNGSESNDRTNDDYECKPCGIRFQTIGLYQAHCRKMHENNGEEHSPRQEFDQDTSQDQRTDSISEDLQKLQTMILQLNGLDQSVIGKVLQSCNICGKECESRSALRIHMATEHGNVSDNPLSPGQEKSPSSTNVTAFCTLCEKDYVNQEALKKHIVEEHQANLPNPLLQVPTTTSSSSMINSTTNLTTPNSNNQTQSEKKIASMTPTSSYCVICNKELCNKYFMKTHMQKMHGIQIENGAQIGGVICNICNKELCSKYFLRVHKHNSHGIVNENTSSSSSAKQESFDASSSEDAALKPEQLGDLSHRYFTYFTEVCPFCSRRFRSIKWLKAHLLNDHGKNGIDKWREMEQQNQTSTSTKSNNRSAGASASTAAVAAATNSSKSSAQLSNLKIPNGFELTQQNKPTDLTGLGNQVLSNLLGSSSDDQQLKSYRCSYCNFSTTVLPFLFLHERSHVNPQENIETESNNTLQCPICSQRFHQPEQLHQHLLTRHQFSALLTQFQTPPPILQTPNVDQEKLGIHLEPKNNTKLEETKEDSSVINQTQINQPTIQIQSEQQQVRNNLKVQEDNNPVQVTPHGTFKCAQCGYATTNVNRIRRHVKKDHTAIGDPTDSVIAELSKTLKDIANRHKVPACYAMPQDANVNIEKTIMQPFLIDEQQDPSSVNSDDSNSEKRFTPALVYLPVKSRISSALTASFTLTPA
ncbi:zinc finger protein 423-like [Polistes fuscatus]|uniref:zinc finger protein 423-like n=1 Tax=Polistes fuscatus TaxID=30207 RepID=UPI001CAA2934|nr:zinc finger protein 423-like [Polistes fuscatus]